MLSKKRSRPISLDGHQFRWSLAEDDEFVVLAVQRADTNGQRLEAIIRSKADWGSIWDHHLENPQYRARPVTPSLVSKIMAHALQLEWQPEK